MRKALVNSLIDAGCMVLDYCVGSKRGLRYPRGQFRWVDLTLVASVDASFAEEEAIVHGQKRTQRCQRGRRCLLSSSECFAKQQFPVHLISHSSTVIRRVCRSTTAGEINALQASVEESMWVRATITDLQGKLTLRNWEPRSAANRQTVRFDECRSLADHLKSPTSS